MCGCKMPFSNTHLNFIDLCRLCLSKDNILIPVFDNSLIGHQLSDKINVCLTVNIKTEDEVSQKICHQCLTKVNAFFDYRSTTLECQKVLQRWVSEANQSQLNKDSDKGAKEDSSTELNKTNETYESENDCDSRSSFESITSERIDEDDVARELFEKSFDCTVYVSEAANDPDYDRGSEVPSSVRSHSESINSERNDEDDVASEIDSFDCTVNVSEGDIVSPNSEVPGPSGLQQGQKQSPPIELTENEEWPDGNKRVANKTLNTCEFCGQSFTKFKLELHRRKHTGERPFKCSEPGCDRAFASKGMLSSHSRVHSSNRPYPCDYCSSSFKTAIHLSNHIKIHTGEKPYYCDLCDYSCIYKATLLIHRKRHLKIYSVICEICGKGFYSASDLKEHVSGHTGETPFSCSKCDKKFPNKYHLRKHKNSVHNKTLNSPVSVQCEKCSKVCPDKHSYKNHVRRVHANKKFECDICGKLIGNKSYLAEHMRIHSGEKPYVCELCGKSFTGRKSMKMHQVVHTGEKKYECENCGKKFTQKSSLNAHKKLHITNS
ncbi:zinc finger protein 260 isoform X3 [Halyomorpha halys]|uniref:zinc finger protein 260 isoform X3 n=1 Tax=Halyomorpha halys TaxID=286706 RepID=UPI0006D4F7ED|nr:zinc finger protein 12-like isoform X3 [Halyomorpha halys]